MSRLIRNYQPNPRTDDPLCLTCEHNKLLTGGSEICEQKCSAHPEAYRCIKFERRAQNARPIR